MEPVQRTIWLCDRDLEGRKNNCDYRCHPNQISKEKLINKKHWFMIISKKSTQEFVTVLPLSSKEYQIYRNFGEQINDGDIKDSPDSTKTFDFKKKTFVLCNKPCRIPIEDFNNEQDYGRLKKDIYTSKILFNLKQSFMSK